MPGQIGIPAVYSPMTRTLEDLDTFWRAIMSMKPWEYDHSVSLVTFCVNTKQQKLRGILVHSAPVAASRPDGEETQIWRYVG